MRHRPLAPACLLAGLLVATSAAFAQSSALPMPLDSADPAKPIEVIDDRTWTGADVQAQAKDWSKLDLAAFTYDDRKGPAVLVVDYAAVRPNDEDGQALIDIGIECPEAPQPCTYPIQLGSMSIRTAFMGESVAMIDGQPKAVWVARQSHAYSFKPGTLVTSWLSLEGRTNVEPQAIRARWIYGNHDHAALPGQQTRVSLLLKIVATIGALLLLGLWWMRRQ